MYPAFSRRFSASTVRLTESLPAGTSGRRCQSSAWISTMW